MKNSLYDRVTRKIIAEMEAGILPWEKPWADGEVIEAARNAVTGRSYSGINVLLLWDAVCQQGFSTNRWMTFNQARRTAGGVRRHEKGTRIVFATRYVPRAERERVEAGIIPPHQAETRFHMKAYSVFNLDQVADAPARLWPRPRTAGASERCREVEALAEGVGAKIRSRGNDAYYHHLEDFIAIPPMASFVETDDYCSTLLHELTHWTGHPSRLGRPFGQAVTDSEYIHEELIAELGAAYLSANYGIRPRARHSDYIAYWLAALKADSRVLFTAARSASEAADYLLARLTMPPGELAHAHNADLPPRPDATRAEDPIPTERHAPAKAPARQQPSDGLTLPAAGRTSCSVPTIRCRGGSRPARRDPKAR